MSNNINLRDVGGAINHNDLLDMPSSTNSNHDGRYYTETELSSTDSNSGASLIGISTWNSATYNNVQDWMNTTQSAGLLSGGIITDSGSGQIDVSAGTGFVKSTNSEIGVTKFLDWETTTNIELTDNTKNTVYIDGADQLVKVTTTPKTTLDYTTKFPIGAVFRVGTELHILNEAGTRIYDLARRTHHRARELRGFERASGLVTGDAGTRHITTTAGVVYAGLNRITFPEFDSTTTDFTTWYYDGDLGTPAWVEGTGSQLDNVQYNNIATGLVNLTSKRYGVHWIFVDIDGHANVVYGQGNYTLTQAQSSVLPASLPGLVKDFSILVARVIVQEGETEIVEIATAFETLFPTATATDHGELSGLSDDDHTQYLLADGSRKVSGNLIIGYNDYNSKKLIFQNWDGSNIVDENYIKAYFDGGVSGVETYAYSDDVTYNLYKIKNNGFEMNLNYFGGSTTQKLDRDGLTLEEGDVYSTDSTSDLGTSSYPWNIVYTDEISDDGTNTTTPANLKSAYTHISNNGSDHSYINQDVTSGATPTFGDIKGETKCTDFVIIDPNSAYSTTTKIPSILAKANLKITRLKIDLNTTAQDVAGDLKYTDDLQTFTNATLIRTFDTSSGVLDATGLNLSVAAGKEIYLDFDSQPHADITFMKIHMEWDYD